MNAVTAVLAIVFVFVLVIVAFFAVAFAWARNKGKPYTDDIQRENMRTLYGDNTK